VDEAPCSKMFDLGSPVLPENRSALFDVMAFGRRPMTNTADLLQTANSRKRVPFAAAIDAGSTIL
jgi:hypothetical protein